MKRLLPVLLALQLAAASAVLGWVALRPAQAASASEAAAHGAAHSAPTAAPGNASEPARPVEPAHPVESSHGSGGAVHSANTPADPHAPPPAAVRTPAQVLEALAVGNRRFVAGDRRERMMVAERKELVAGQHPGAIVLACSDSRVPPELVFDQSLGELFVVRTAGNVADPVALGSIEYAAEHLHVGLLVVLGHEKCGAVTAAAQGGAVASRNLQAVLGLIAPAVQPLQAKASGAELVHLGVEANVEASLAHVLDASPVLTELLQKKQLVAKRAIYDLQSGEVRVW